MKDYIPDVLIALVVMVVLFPVCRDDNRSFHEQKMQQRQLASCDRITDEALRVECITDVAGDPTVESS